jgi:hypothetical protein
MPLYLIYFTHVCIIIWKFLVCSSVFDLSILLGYGTMPLANWCLIFSESTVFSSSMVKKSVKTTMLSQNVRHQSSSDMVLHPRRKTI